MILLYFLTEISKYCQICKNANFEIWEGRFWTILKLTIKSALLSLTILSSRDISVRNHQCYCFSEKGKYKLAHKIFVNFQFFPTIYTVKILSKTKISQNILTFFFHSVNHVGFLPKSFLCSVTYPLRLDVESFNMLHIHRVSGPITNLMSNRSILYVKSWPRGGCVVPRNLSPKASNHKNKRFLWNFTSKEKFQAYFEKKRKYKWFCDCCKHWGKRKKNMYWSNDTKASNNKNKGFFWNFTSKEKFQAYFEEK